jgi:hypothetical protein
VFLPYWLDIERVGLCANALGKLIMAEKQTEKGGVSCTSIYLDMLEMCIGRKQS